MTEHRIFSEKDVDWRKYTSFFSGGLDSSPFVSPEWLLLIAGTRSDLRLRLLAFLQDREIVAYFPYFEKRHFPFQFMALPLGCYGAVVAPSIGVSAKAIEYLAKLHPFVDLLTVNSQSSKPWDEIFSKRTVSETYVSVLDAKYEEYFETLPGKTRNQIRKFRKSSTSIELADHESCGTDLFPLYEALVRKHNIKRPYPKCFFDKLGLLSGPNSSLRLYKAKVDGNVAAFSVFLYARSHCFYWLNASDPAYSKYNCNNGILDSVLSANSAMSSPPLFNWGAVPPGNAGLSHFKESWNAKPSVTYCFKGKYAL